MTDQTHSTAITPTHVEAIREYLEGAGVEFQLVKHDSVMSAAAEAAAAQQPPDQVAKTIVLHDGSAYVVAAIPASDRLDLHKLRRLLGASRQLQLASEDLIAHDFPSLEVGAIPPFGPMVPAAEVIDRSLLEHERILCPAGDHRHSVLVAPSEVKRITAALIADICQD
jgi:Ala-tRNA(Pro) deacylase